MRFEEIVQSDRSHVIQTYGRMPLVLVRGEGVKVWDSEGRAYYDFLSGLGVNSLGHCHPRIVAAVREQVGRLIHVSNLYYTLPQVELAERLSRLFGEGRCFFCNSGTEAVEAAIKLAKKAKGRHQFVAMQNSFHGRTCGALTATGQEKYRKDFEPLLPGFSYAPFNDLDAVKALVTDRTAGIIVEPVQGEGGVYIAQQGFLEGLRRLADETGAALIFDEVQCGLGRTGRVFCFEHYGVQPDVVCMAKALAGGLPMGAIVATAALGEAFTRGNHASTFGGNPLACSAALATLDVLCADGFLDRVRSLSAQVVSWIEEFHRRRGGIREIRAKGFMFGVEIESPVAVQVVAKAREKGLLANAIGDRILRLLPPLIATESDLREGFDILRSAIEETAP